MALLLVFLASPLLVALSSQKSPGSKIQALGDLEFPSYTLSASDARYLANAKRGKRAAMSPREWAHSEVGMPPEQK